MKLQNRSTNKSLLTRDLKMAKDKYDPYAGFYRVATAAENLNMEVVEVVTLHLVLEREIERVLAGTLIRIDNLADLSFREKAIVLHATWPGSVQNADRLYTVLKCFNSLRNDFAHGKTEKIAGHRQSLITAYKEIDPSAKDPITSAAIAQGVCAFMGGGMMPNEFRDFADKLHKVVHEGLPAAIKGIGQRARQRLSE